MIRLITLHVIAYSRLGLIPPGTPEHIDRGVCLVPKSIRLTNNGRKLRQIRWLAVFGCILFERLFDRFRSVGHAVGSNTHQCRRGIVICIPEDPVDCCRGNGDWNEILHCVDYRRGRIVPHGCRSPLVVVLEGNPLVVRVEDTFPSEIN